MIFFLEITNIFQKFLDFWFQDFFLRFLKSKCKGMDFPVRIFGSFECVSTNVLFNVITNLKFYKCCFIKDDTSESIIGWCPVRKRNP